MLFPSAPVTLRILFVTPSIAREFGGPVSDLQGSVRALVDHGWQVEVATTRCSADDTSRFIAAAQPHRLHQFAYSGEGAFRRSASLLAWIVRHARRYDVVHAFGLLNPVSSLAASIARRRRVPLAITPLGTLSRYTFAHRRSTLKRVWHTLIDAPNIARAMVHFETAGERDEAVRLALVPADHAVAVAPPYMAERDADGPVESVVEGPPTILFLSRIDPKKNVEAVIDAMPAVAGERPDARLRIAGAGDERYVATLRRRAAAIDGGASRISFEGFVSGAAKSALLRSAAVLVLPSKSENVAFAVLDALAHGVPVIVSQQMHIAPWVARHRLGLVAAPEAPALAAAVAHVLADSELRDRVRRIGAEVVGKHFSPRQYAIGMERLYQAAKDATPPERNRTA